MRFRREEKKMWDLDIKMTHTVWWTSSSFTCPCRTLEVLALSNLGFVFCGLAGRSVNAGTKMDWFSWTTVYLLDVWDDKKTTRNTFRWKELYLTSNKMSFFSLLSFLYAFLFSCCLAERDFMSHVHSVTSIYFSVVPLYVCILADKVELMKKEVEP